jgi:hypothetical protein
MQPELKNSFGQIVAAVSLPAFTLFLFGPILVFLTNADQFPIGLSGLLPWQLFAALAVLAGLAALLSAVPRRVRPVFVLLAAAVGLLCWLQGQVLVWRYGILDGTGIVWPRHYAKGIIDGTVWILLIGAGLALRRRILPMIARISLFLLLVQAGTVFLLFVRTPSAWKAKPEPGLVVHRYAFSAATNVLILILDEFQSDIFAEIVSREPGLSLPLDGFTFFKDCSGSYTNTAAAVPLILTGRYTDNSEPHSLFIRRAFRERSLPKVLWEHGFRLDMYPRFESINLVQLPMEWLEPKSQGRSPWLAALPSSALLTDISLFRHAPHFIKPLIYRQQAWLLSPLARRLLEGAGPPGAGAQKSVREPGSFRGFGRDLLGLGLDFKFMNEFMRDARLAGSRPVFKYYHWNAVHPPLGFDENFAVTRPEFGRAAYVSQAKGCLKMTGMFLARLRELGVYDRTMILIMGDHGCGRTPDLLVNPQDGPHSRMLANGNPYQRFPYVKSRACPLLLVKPRHSRGVLKTSLAPVSHLDVIPTILADLGIAAQGFSGQPVSSVLEADGRERRFLAYSWNGGLGEYLTPLVEYRIAGPCWDDASWSRTGRVYRAAR